MELLYLFLLLPSALLYAQDFSTIQDSLKNKYEYIGYHSKHAVAEARTKTGKYTLLNSKGKQLFPPKYDYIYIEPDGWIQASLKTTNGYKRGYINRDGSQRIPIIYDDVYSFEDKTIRVKSYNKVGIVDSIGKAILPIHYEGITEADKGYYFVKKNSYYALFNNDSPVTGFNFKEVSRFENKKCAVVLKDNRATIIDTLGTSLFEPMRNHLIMGILPDHAVVLNTKTKKEGLIDYAGNFLIACKYDKLRYANGVIVVMQNNKYGLVSLNDKSIIPFDNEFIYSQINNLFVAMKNDKWGVINSEGAKVIDTKYRHVTIYKDKYILATNDIGNTGILDLNGIPILPFTYRFYSIFHNTVLCSDGTNCYSLHLNGNEAPIVSALADVDSFKEYGMFNYEQNGYQVFKKDGKYGLLYILRLGVTIPAIYDDISQIYATSEYIIKLEGKYGIINAHNEIIEKPVYDEIILRKEFIVLKIKGTKDKFKDINFKQLPED